MIASLFFVSVCVSDCCNFCNCHSDFPDFVDLKIQYFGEIIYNISSKIYIGSLLSNKKGQFDL
nr:MAG TPA: hypothetical protein [Bacteriophage sp.]